MFKFSEHGVKNKDLFCGVYADFIEWCKNQVSTGTFSTYMDGEPVCFSYGEELTYNDYSALEKMTKSKKVKIALEDGTFEKDFLDGSYEILIFLDETCIGSIVGYAAGEFIHIEIIKLDEPYRGKGYGSLAMQELKNIGRALGVKYIDGECRPSRKNFYKKVGGEFVCREPDDLNFILDKFYIDL